jgi:hypothetical protein
MKTLLWVAFALATGGYLSSALRDPDLWWHITAGRWIVANGLPSVDHWNVFGMGKPWTAYSWSHEIAYALADRLGGLEGLVVLQALLGLFIAFTLFYCLGEIAKDRFLGSILGIISVGGCVGHFGLRPQSLTWACFILIIYLADKISESGLTLRRSLGLIVVMSVWANSHITSALGLFVLGAWLLRVERLSLETWEECILDNKTLFASLALSFLGTLITPYFGYEWIIFVSKSGHPLMHSTILEFGPATILDYATGIVVILLVLLLTLIYFRPRVISAPRLGAVCLFTIGALAVVKFMPFATIVLAASIARSWSSATEERAAGLRPFGNLEEAIEKLRDGFLRVQGAGLVFLVGCIPVIRISDAIYRPIDKVTVPYEAVAFIKSEDLPVPILNAFGEGGYLMYRFSSLDGELPPERHVTIDGRTNVNPVEIMERNLAAFYGRQSWEDYLTTVQPKSILWKNRSPLPAILIASGRWCRVFRNGSETEGFSVFITQEEFSRRALPSDNCRRS